jgi:hypothetical protein
VRVSIDQNRREPNVSVLAGNRCSQPHARLKSAAQSTLEDGNDLDAPRFSPYRNPSLRLRQNLFALLFGLWIVFFGILHGETFFDQAATLLLFAHLHIDLTKSDVVH